MAVFVEVSGEHGIGQGFLAGDFNASGDCAFTLIEIDVQPNVFMTGSNIQPTIAIEISNRHRTRGRCRGAKGLLVAECAFTVIDVDHALAGIAAGHNHIAGPIAIHIGKQDGG